MTALSKVRKAITFVFVGVSCAAACSRDAAADFLEIDTYPASISTSCRDGVAQIYDECSDQNIVLDEAKRRAAATGKSVLIVYGAEWCIWCHVFEKYVEGQSRRFVYEYEYDGEPQYWPMRERENRNAELEAIQLNRFVAKNFVVANIEGHYSPNGIEVLASTGYDARNLTFVPLFVVLDENGSYAGEMLSVEMIAGLEIRADSGEEYRGYDRKVLLRELQKLRDLSIGGQLH